MMLIAFILIALLAVFSMIHGMALREILRFQKEQIRMNDAVNEFMSMVHGLFGR